jgi:hypothetical protein
MVSTVPTSGSLTPDFLALSFKGTDYDAWLQPESPSLH